MSSALYATLSGWFTVWVLPVLALIPKQVWYALLALVAILYYGHWKEGQGVKKCQAAVQVAVAEEKDRQTRIQVEIRKLADKQVAEARDRANQREQEANNVMEEARKLKSASTVCIPGSITKRLRQLK
jgi:hypothetical protein